MPFKILSIDGGGIRGIIPASVLVEVEKAIQAKDAASGRPPRKIGDVFDMIAGTSTGGILTCIFLAPDKGTPPKARFSASDALQLYLDNGADIFDRSIWHAIRGLGGLADERYPAAGLERVLVRYFDKLELRDLIRPCLITAFDTKKYRPFFFTQADAVNDPSSNYLVREVARATSAAPTYFQPAQPESIDDIPNANPMVDGGVFANNPTACALVEAFKVPNRPQRPEDVVILSLGTGHGPDSISFSECKDWGLVGWAKPILGLMMEGVAQTVDYQMTKLFESMHCSEQYLRLDGVFGDIQADLDVEGLDPAMDHASPQNMARLRAFGAQLAKNRAKEIEAFTEAYL